jgi:protein SCO1
LFDAAFNLHENIIKQTTEAISTVPATDGLNKFQSYFLIAKYRIMKNKIWIPIVVFFILLGGGFIYYLHASTPMFKKTLPVLGHPGHVIGPFSLQDQEGKTITEKDLNGKVTVVEYFFTTCTGICPRMNANMDKLYKAMKGTPNFQIFSYTVNPSYDKVPVLAKYAEQYNADPKVWKFLTGPRQEINDLAVNDYLLGAADSTISTQFVHTQWWALIDKQRQIRGFYDGLSMKDIKKLETTDIPSLLAEK